MRSLCSRSMVLAALVVARLCGDALAGSDAAIRATPRITNGVLTQDRPNTGGLLVSNGNDHFLICSGTMIGCRTFLTAAHCVCQGFEFSTCGTPGPSGFSVYLQNVGILDIAAIDVDPTYSFASQGDVAVITLSTPIDGVAPSPINTMMRPAFGTSGEIVGFGFTRGGGEDSGMLRRGFAETAACDTAVDADKHVCWTFMDPVGPRGEDSNTCTGDSGGPLFADLGTGESVVGVTSGGSTPDCQPTDNSFDADVYVHRTFIEAAGGADLSNSTCGAGPQVGETGAEVTAFDFDMFTAQQKACRRNFAKASTGYVLAALRARQGCLHDVNRGSASGPCPDADTAEAIDKAVSRVNAERLAAKCTPIVIAEVLARGVCSAAADATDLASCIVAAGDAAVHAAVDVEYADADPVGPIAAAADRSCQDAVARAGADLLKASLKASSRCKAALAAGNLEACPDTRAAASITKAEAKATAAIREGCSDAAVVSLDDAGVFGGSCAGVATAIDLAACQLAEHADANEAVVGLLGDLLMPVDVSFTVPPGAASMRVTLNGEDAIGNDLDFVLRYGAPATASLYDYRENNGGMFESFELPSPGAGTWYAHILRHVGAKPIPYQLTATTFQP